VIYDNGSIYEASVLDVTFADIVAKFAGAANNMFGRLGGRGGAARPGMNIQY